MFLDLGLTVMIPLSVILFIAGFFLSQKYRQGAAAKVKEIIVKIVFLVIGIPIIGSTYTQLLDEIGKSSTVSNDFITYTVASTFVDFESWVRKSNLAPATIDGTEFKAVYDSTKGTTCPHYETWLNLRSTAVCINKAYADFLPVAEATKIGDSGGMVLNLDLEEVYATFKNLAANADDGGSLSVAYSNSPIYRQHIRNV